MIRLFQNNYIYLSIRANIIKTLLLDKKELKLIYKGIYTQQTAPETIQEKIQEGKYRSITLKRLDIAVYFCFIQVLLIVFQQFLNLSNNTLKIESNYRKQKRDPYSTRIITRLVKTTYKNQFLRYTQLVRFRITKIINRLRDAKDIVVEVLESFMENNSSEIISQRSSILYTNTYKQF